MVRSSQSGVDPSLVQALACDDCEISTRKVRNRSPKYVFTASAPTLAIFHPPQSTTPPGPKYLLGSRQNRTVSDAS